MIVNVKSNKDNMLRFLKYPQYENELDNLRARVAYFFVLFVTVFQTSRLFLALAVPEHASRFIIQVIYILIAGGVSLYFINTNRYKTGTVFHLSAIHFFLFFGVFFTNGLYSINFIGLFIVIMMSGVLLSWKYGLIVSVINISFTIVVYWIQVSGWLPAPMFKLDPGGTLLALLMMFVLVFVSQLTLSIMLENTFSTLREQLRDKEAYESQLIEQNITLKELNTQYLEEKKKAEEANHLQASFLANMSHEIRTPMNAIIGFSSILDDEDTTPEERKQFIYKIHKRSADLLEIINNVLDISKIDSNKMRLNCRTVKLQDLIDEIVQTITIISESNPGVNPQFSSQIIIPDGIENIFIDEFRVKQIVLNFLTNAYKFTKMGTIILKVYFSENNRLINFAVQDTGIGISEDKIGIIFDRFRQVDENYFDRVYGGTGLGLSIALGLANLMGGTIDVRSRLGYGSEFTLTLEYLDRLIK